MKKSLFAVAAALLIIFSSCEKQAVEPEGLDVSTLKSGKAEKVIESNGQSVMNFRAHLTGEQEVPARETEAVGQAIFQLRNGGTELHYKLIVANLDNITMAHIHKAPAGVNGGVVAWLYPPSAPAMLISGTTNGVLKEGIIKKENLTGALAGMELSDLVALFAEGTAYVNVHTTRYPGGEIRGQIFGNVKGN